MPFKDGKSFSSSHRKQVQLADQWYIDKLRQAADIRTASWLIDLAPR